nr:CDP-alcohol phosphatidyltransferase family protein [Anaerolineae bacterium]
MTDETNATSSTRQALSERLRDITRPVINAVAGVFIKLGFSPDLLTFLGLIMAGVSAFLAANGKFAWAGIVIIVGGPFDALDGAVARVSGRVSRFGALLDSTLDRYGEALILSGIGCYLLQQDHTVGVLLVFASLFGSVMVSYVRARSEGLQIDNKVGIATRLERVIILTLALLTGLVVPGLWLLAILAHITVIQRMWQGFRVTRQDRQGNDV